MKDDAWGCFGMIVAATVTVVVSAVWGGYVISVLWGWFMVELFGLPRLTYLQAIGVNLVISAFLSGVAREKAEPTEGANWFIVAAMRGLLSPTLFLATGWLLHLFM